MSDVAKSTFGEIQEAVNDCCAEWLRRHGNIPPSTPPDDPPDPSGVMNQVYGIATPQDMKSFLQGIKVALREKRFDYYKMDTSNSHLIKLLSKSLQDVEADIAANTKDL